MNRNLLNYLLLAVCLIGTKPGFSQTLPPNQPEQDACSALVICGNFTTPYSYVGEGNVLDLPTTPCYSPELNSVWFRLNVNTAGIIVFEIQPIDPQDDYDFAVVDITNGNCNNIQQSQVIRCNFNNNEQPNNYYPNGIVGLNTTSTLTAVPGGTYGEPFLEEINANAGDVYLIMVNNFGHDNCYGSCPGSGFTLDFTGSTATFNQPPPPQLDSVVASCNNADSITIQLTENALCSSIASDGSDFYLTPSGTITGAHGIACSGSQGYTNKVTVTFNGALADGNYVIHADTGTDGNTILGLCNAPLAVPDSLLFSVGQPPILMTGIDSPACQTLSVHTDAMVNCSSIAADGSDFSVVGPTPVNVDGATGVGCTSAGQTQVIKVHLSQPIPVDGAYTLHAKIGSDGNTLTGSCGKVMPVGTSANFKVNSFNGLLTAGPDTMTCNNETQLYVHNSGIAPPGGFQYTWTPGTGIQDIHDPNSMAILTPGSYNYVLSTIDSAGCYLRDSMNITLFDFHGIIQPTDVSVCTEQAVPFHASNGISFKWSDNANFTGTPTDLSCINCANPIGHFPIGNHQVYVAIANNIGCHDTVSSLIHVLPNPVITAEPVDTTIKYGDGFYLRASGASFYTWKPEGSLDDPMSRTPYATPKKNTTYIVIGVDKNGCQNSDTTLVKIDYTSPVFIPNAFTPNGDGLNDVFKIEHITFKKVLVFNIFDRWGNVVFQTQDKNKGWDGTYRGKPEPQGTYNYYIKVAFPNNKKQVFKGTVTLLR